MLLSHIFFVCLHSTARSKATDEIREKKYTSIDQPIFIQPGLYKCQTIAANESCHDPERKLLIVFAIVWLSMTDVCVCASKCVSIFDRTKCSRLVASSYLIFTHRARREDDNGVRGRGVPLIAIAIHALYSPL